MTPTGAAASLHACPRLCLQAVTCVSYDSRVRDGAIPGGRRYCAKPLMSPSYLSTCTEERQNVTLECAAPRSLCIETASRLC